MGVPAVDLHGNLSQNARERNLEAFTTGTVRVLVATDIAARGIHVDDVDLVVHVDPPAEHKAYLHRSGRTARAGSGGTVVTIMLSEQRGDVRQLLRAAKISARPQPPAGALVDQLVGQEAPRVAPENAPAAAARRPAPQGQRRPGKGRPGARRASGGGQRPARGRGGRDRNASATGGSRSSQRSGTAGGGARDNRPGGRGTARPAGSAVAYSTSSAPASSLTTSGMQASWAGASTATSGAEGNRRRGRRPRRADRPAGAPGNR